MEIRNLFYKGGSLADLRYKEKERKSRSWEIAEETTREEYTLDWSQSEVFLVLVMLILSVYIYTWLAKKQGIICVITKCWGSYDVSVWLVLW